MRKWKYLIAVLVLAVDILLFAELGKEISAPGSSVLLTLLNFADYRTMSGWIMIALAALFVVGLAITARWAFADLKRWVLREVGEGD